MSDVPRDSLPPTDPAAIRDPSVLPGAVSVRWASVLSVAAILALFAALAMLRHPHVLRVPPAGLAVEGDVIVLRLPIASAVAARLRPDQPVALELASGPSRDVCRIEGRLAGAPRRIDGAPSAGLPQHLLRIDAAPAQRARCAVPAEARHDARLDLGSDSYASMFAAALLRR